MAGQSRAGRGGMRSREGGDRREGTGREEEPKYLHGTNHLLLDAVKGNSVKLRIAREDYVIDNESKQAH